MYWKKGDPAFQRIALLYAVEKAARGEPPKERVALRQQKAKPVSIGLEAWIAA